MHAVMRYCHLTTHILQLLFLQIKHKNVTDVTIIKDFLSHPTHFHKKQDTISLYAK